MKVILSQTYFVISIAASGRLAISSNKDNLISGFYFNSHFFHTYNFSSSLHFFSSSDFNKGDELSKAILTGNPSPLWMAADGGCISLLRIMMDMLEKCPTFNRPQPSPDGTSALEIATAHGHHGIMLLLGKSKLFSMEEVRELCHKFEEYSFLKEHFGHKRYQY